MDNERIEIISPLVDRYRPNLSDAEKIVLTAKLRPYFEALYDVFCRLDRDGLLDGDSPERGGNDIVGVV